MKLDKPAKFKLEELRTDLAFIKNLELTIGKVSLEEDWERLGPTPTPSLLDLRRWDMRLLARYRPFYAPICDMCCLCTYGKCDLSRGRRGACGMDIEGQQARIVLLACCMGAAAHTGHARHLLDHLIEKFGPDTPLDMGKEIAVEAPLTRTIYGIKPKTLDDLREVLNWCEQQIVQALSATCIGQEADPIDFESKALHIGMVDHVGMEIADIAQIVSFHFPKGEQNAPLVELGMGTVDRSKPVILCIGHNVASGVEAVDYLISSGQNGQVEMCALCCTAHDLTRHGEAREVRAKVIGPLSQTLRFVRSGIADVIMVDEQCVRVDILLEAKARMTPVIATNDKICLGLPDRTGDPVDAIVDDLVNGAPGALIADVKKAGEVAVKTAIKLAPKRARFKGQTMTMEELHSYCSKCTACEECRRVCPNNLPLPEAIQSVAKLTTPEELEKYEAGKTAENPVEKLSNLYEACLICGRCDYACPQKIPIQSLISKAAESAIAGEKHKLRVGKGPILDTEIREVGAPIVMGEIPGVIAIVGCPNYRDSYKDVGRIAEEFLERRYIVVSSGCEAMDLARYRTLDGESLYEKYPGVFDGGGLVNTGSCVSNAWISGAAVKIASIFARRNIRANFEEIADYILNRVGACGISWGAMSQKAASIATGFNRLGIPVIVGPQGSKYRRMYLGRKDREEDWYVYDARTGDKVYVGPTFEHLMFVAETVEECIVMAAKLCLRANDTAKGRMIKLSHYIELHKKYFGSIPDDIHLYVRTVADIPATMKDEILEVLKAKGWKESARPALDPTLLERLVRKTPAKNE
ncbi:MAG: CO dehydrogenase/acetyl-CoA synthase complex subunit alpha [Candidatus Bathyarchaeia archaeon]